MNGATASQRTKPTGRIIFAKTKSSHWSFITKMSLHVTAPRRNVSSNFWRCHCRIEWKSLRPQLKSKLTKYRPNGQLLTASLRENKPVSSGRSRDDSEADCTMRRANRLSQREGRRKQRLFPKSAKADDSLE